VPGHLRLEVFKEAKIELDKLREEKKNETP